LKRFQFLISAFPKMKQYTNYSSEDFATDADFLAWVKYPTQNAALDQFWQNWMNQNPTKKETVDEARMMILAVVKEKKYVPLEGVQKEIWHRINETIGEEKMIPFWQRWYSKAAILVIVALSGALLYSWLGKAPAVSRRNADAVFEKQVNNTQQAKTFVLSDGSTIVLQPRGILEYPVKFAGNLREVYLTGEAFFEITRDPGRPFLVHAHEIVTRVLGTSFTVRNSEHEKKIVVSAKTGNVVVFRERHRVNAPDEAVVGVVLTPNQQVVYLRTEMKMIKSLVENPDILIPVAIHESEFTGAPVKKVMEFLEKIYGVNIVYDEEVLLNCYVSISLTDAPFHEKLKRICHEIGATYEVIGSDIVVYGNACQSH
jgi:transmembrane sensor